ncbi:MAG: hypothetical protein KJZ93_28675 [Caldilineaceae bacterium]|nr:hypothetical protein [Caldilineaceae bacterium]
MNEQPHQDDKNPLEHFADEATAALGGKPVELIEQSAEQVSGGQVSMASSMARRVRASAMHMQDSVAGVVQTGSLDAQDSVLGVVAARKASLDGVNASVLVVGHAEVEQLRAFAVFGGQIDGNVRAVLTPLAALMAGSGFALTLWGLNRLMGRIRKNRINRSLESKR